MKKTISIFILLPLSYSFSQSGWFWINPQPQGNTIYEVKFVNNNTAFAVGAPGTILKTTNAGNNWYRVNSNTIIWLNSISFINETTGYVGGVDLLKTTDSGENWYQVSSQEGKVFFINDNTGFAIGRVPWGPPTYNAGFIAKTTNGGINWNSSTFPLAMWFNAIDIRNNNVLVCGTGFDGAIIFRSTNLGENWYYTPTNTTGDLQSINILSDNDVISTGFTQANGKILKSSNSGNNWNVIDTSMQPYIYGSYFLNINTGFIVGLHGTIYKTINSGFNWSVLNTGFNNYFYSISFNSLQQGIIVGTSGITYLSSNTGNSWEMPFERFTSTNLLKMQFLNNDTGLILADSNKIFRTTNCGLNWTENRFEWTSRMLGLYFLNYNTGFCVGYNGSIFKTTNGCLNWENLSMNNGAFFCDVQMIDDNTGYIAGSYDRCYKTTNGGINWSLMLTGYTMLMLDIYFTSPDIGYLLGSEQSILRTSNAGLNWNRVLYLSSVINLHSMVFTNSSIGYACGSSGRIFKTTNGGQNWFQQAVGLTNRELYSISFGNSSVGYAVGLFGNIFYTSNGGVDWILQNSTTGNELRAIHAFDSGAAIVVGYGGNILKTTTGGQYIGVKNIQTSYPKHFKLYNNYPNPFNPTTKIKFEISKEGFVQLIIFNILGQQSTFLIDQYLNLGVYEAEWNASNYSSGVYFYTLKTEEFTETKKMVLIR